MNNYVFQVEKDPYNKIWHKTPSYLGPKLWNLVPNEYKTIESLTDFKAKIKSWVPALPSNTKHVHQIGFI